MFVCEATAGHVRRRPILPVLASQLSDFYEAGATDETPLFNYSGRLEEIKRQRSFALLGKRLTLPAHFILGSVFGIVFGNGSVFGKWR